MTVDGKPLQAIEVVIISHWDNNTESAPLARHLLSRSGSGPVLGSQGGGSGAIFLYFP